MSDYTTHPDNSQRPQRTQRPQNQQPAAPPRPMPPLDSEEMKYTVGIAVAGSKSVRDFSVREVFESGKAKPTKNGNYPTTQDVRAYLEYCRASSLDPLGPDANLVGRDTSSGPAFTSQSSFSSMLRIAELSGKYAGLAYGVVCQTAKGDIVSRDGELFYPGDTIVGAWARVKRRDWDDPVYNAVPLANYSAGFGLWLSNPGLMITKIAIASCLRKAFMAIANMYCDEEMDSALTTRVAERESARQRAAANPALSLLTGASKAADAPEDTDSSPI